MTKTVEPKYELTPSGAYGFKRIKALRDIPAFNVKAGDLGGLIATEYNLSQDGDCWVGYHAKVDARGTVRDNAFVTDEARITGIGSVGRGGYVGGKTIIAQQPRITFKILHTPKVVCVTGKFSLLLNLTDGAMTSGCGTYLSHQNYLDWWKHRPTREVAHHFGVEGSEVNYKRFEFIRAIKYLQEEHLIFVMRQEQLLNAAKYNEIV